MPHSSPRASLNTDEPHNSVSQTSQTPTHYGFNILAKENLTHITSYLDPTSLFTLSGVNRFLHEHVQDDHTWRRAFLLNFLGIKPEGDLDESTGLLLRRSESSWAREYVVRCNIRRRWESLRNSTIAYAPVHSQVSDIHLLRNQSQNQNQISSTFASSLLASSLQYGIVSRSVLFTGKVLRGFLSPSPSGTGLGIGNPNTEFAPNVSACAMTSDGGTAKIYWGMRNGEVVFLVATKTMDTNTRSAAKSVRCSVQDQHDGEVVQVTWEESGAYVASAAKDGRVKIWDTKTAACLWMSEYLIPDYPTTVRLAWSKTLSDFVVVAGMHSGDVIAWTGLKLDMTPSEAAQVPRGVKVKVTCPVQASPIPNNTSAEPNQVMVDPTITSVHLDLYTDPRAIRIIVSYEGRPEFYRIDIGVDASGQLAAPVTAAFKESHTLIGTVSSIFPCLSRTSAEPSFVLAGTTLGWVCVFAYPTHSIIGGFIEPIRKFEAHLDGSSVTALAWNNVTLVTGSSNGTTSVFDAYTYERLRTFGTPIPRPRGGVNLDQVEGVRKIILSGEKDVMVVAVGDRVMGFRADVVPKTKMVKKLPAKKKARGTTTTKGYAQHALKQLISDSKHENDQESDYMKRVYGREKQQRADLERLGLNEVEAVEYALMLSREEALEREAREEKETQAILDEGVFEGDFDFGEGPSRTTRTPPSSSSSSGEGSPPPVAALSSPSKSPLQRPSRPVYSPYTPPRNSSNQKIQISPRARGEAREAGWGGERSVGEGGIASQSWSSVASSISDMELAGRSGVTKEAEGFPSISPKLSKSLSEGKGAWATGSPAARAMATSSRQSGSDNGRGVGSSSHKVQWQVGEDEDEDLRLAIQLSLEEARMRGEVV